METCQRQFYFSYIADARWDHRDPRLRDLYLLKQVKPIPLWKGDVIHQVLAEYFKNLRQGNRTPLAGTLTLAERLARTQWRFSESGTYRKQGRRRAGAAFAALLEHEYGISNGESFESALEHIRACVRNFYELDERAGISVSYCQGREHLIEPLPWGDEATAFVFGDLRVIVKVDLAFRVDDSRYVIFDWKTGKYDEDATAQLELYILWAHLTLGYALDGITAFVVSLFRNTIQRCQLTESGKFYRLAAIRRSAELISALCLTEHGEPASIGDFNYARDVSVCRRCAFRRVCQEFE